MPSTVIGVVVRFLVLHQERGLKKKSFKSNGAFAGLQCDRSALGFQKSGPWLSSVFRGIAEKQLLNTSGTKKIIKK